MKTFADICLDRIHSSNLAKTHCDISGVILPKDQIVEDMEELVEKLNKACVGLRQAGKLYGQYYLDLADDLERLPKEEK